MPSETPKKDSKPSSEWYCYESKAGVPVTDAEGNRFTTRESLQPGMEVFSTCAVSGRPFKAKITALDLGDEYETLVADDGGMLWSLVFEEGFWGYKHGFNIKAVRKTTP